jgi:hypothetical protein
MNHRLNIHTYVYLIYRWTKQVYKNYLNISMYNLIVLYGIKIEKKKDIVNQNNLSMMQMQLKKVYVFFCKNQFPRSFGLIYLYLINIYQHISYSNNILSYITLLATQYFQSIVYILILLCKQRVNSSQHNFFQMMLFLFVNTYMCNSYVLFVQDHQNHPKVLKNKYNCYQKKL